MKLADQLHPLLNRNSNLSRRNKMKIIRSIYIPTITYAVELFDLEKQNKSN